MYKLLIVDVDKRIKLYYGEEYGVVIESIIGSGTTVYIRVPEIVD